MYKNLSKFLKTFHLCLIFTFVFVLINFSCKNDKSKIINDTRSIGQFTSAKIKYAKGFNIKYFKNYKEIQVIDYKNKNNPVVEKYILIDKNKKVQGNFNNIKIIRTPVQRVICLSTTHVAFVNSIGKTQTIVGISGAYLINNEKVSNLIKINKILDVGYDNNLNYELILSLKPDLIFAYSIIGESNIYINKLKELGLNVVTNIEYLEEIPLAKTEWIKFIAAFYNEENQANSKFDKIEQEYNSYKKLVDNVKSCPTVITGLPWKSIWYVPGGNTNISNFISDAGGKYIYKNYTSSSIIPSGIESVFSKFQNADIWINCGTANSINDILLNDKRLQYFKSFRERKIYNNNAKQNAYGGNDYWESGLMNPQIILKDLITIFHPEVFPDHKFIYFKKLL